MRRFERGDRGPARLDADMRIPREHARADVARELADRLFRYGRVLGQSRHEGMARVVKPIIDSRLRAGGIVSALVAVGSHRARQVYIPNMRLAVVTREADMMEREDIAIRPGIGEA